MVDIQIFEGESEKFLKTVSQFETVESVLNFIRYNLKFETVVEYIDSTAGYIKALIWDFRNLVFTEKTLYFVTEAYVRV